MPTVLRAGRQAERYAKFWLTPVALAQSRSFRTGEISEILALVRENRERFLERWHEYFDSHT